MMREKKKAILVLDNGTSYTGFSFGAEGEAAGEVVFNTSMTGYQEIITDPSYHGQLVTMTYPHIGNYGINADDSESRKPFLGGLIVKEATFAPKNYFLTDTLDHFLKIHQIVGIYGIDTRSLTRRLRDFGARMGVISSLHFDVPKHLSGLARKKGMIGQDLAKEVTIRNVESRKPLNERKYRVAVVDFGVKENILRSLASRSCETVIFPADTPASTLLSSEADGVLLSNGPGDPEAVTYAIHQVERLIGRLPIFGICLGHQILGLALGGKTFKLKFGHHGGNQPVMDLRSRRVEITAQNHGFAVEPASISKEMELTHINLNDQTVEGMRHRKHPLFSVQYHPEAAPGPHDSAYLFDQFIDLMKKG
jgi:carbamoyl-phosphate synthase small subunit